MIEYNIQINNGNEYFGTEGKTITVNEAVKTVDISALAREISHENALIPAQVAENVLQNFAKAAANLMSMGFAIQFMSGNDVVLRIYPDVHVKGGNINLQRAQELDPTVTEITVENAGDLVDKVGVVLRAKAECEQKFTDLLSSTGVSLHRADIIEKAKITRTGNNAPANNDTPNTGGNTGNGGNNGGGSGDEEIDEN